MNKLFEPGTIGSLTLRNRLVRSATAERMATPEGYVTPRLIDLYEELAHGGVGLIITGHMYVHPSGKCHPEMTAVYDDGFVPGLKDLADATHRAGGKVVVQINHGGMQCSAETVTEAVAPSAVNSELVVNKARGLSAGEIESIIDAYAQAARRVKEAGFDGVQIHGAHGYLVSQFLSPFINQRSDGWGSNLQKRMQFLRRVAAAVREQVGVEYPVLIKLGMMDGIQGGLSLEDSLEVLRALPEMGIDAVEISGGISGPLFSNMEKGIKAGENEAYYLPWAHRARPLTSLPILLVGGMRSKVVMQGILENGDADFISLCRPLICEPDFPERLRLGIQEQSICISGNLCFPKGLGEGIACRCQVNRSRRSKP